MAVLVVLACSLQSSAALHAETIVLTRNAVPMMKGVKLEFFTDQRTTFVDTYTTQITLDQIVSNARGETIGAVVTRHAYGATKHPNFQAKDEHTIDDLLHGRWLNSTWLGNGKNSRDTFAWLSRDVCDEIKHRGETRLTLASRSGSTQSLMFHRLRHVQHPITAQGQPSTLNSIELRSERGDTLIILADCNNPLVVEADILGQVRWRLDSVTLPRLEGL